jgi:GSH-dependent disulfide-bond oxidoreductase
MTGASEMIDFYAGNTPNNQRVAIVLEELALPYNLHKIDVLAGGAKTPEFLNVNPNGLTPVIVDSDGPDRKPATISQSWVICLYLADKAGRFIPKDELGRLRVLEALFHLASDVMMAHSTHTTLSRFVPEKVPSIIGFYEQRLLAVLQNLDRQLAHDEYLAGDLSIADFGLYPVFHRRRAMVEGKPEFANLQRWGRLMDAHPACRRGIEVMN